jgi:hypothetical protein
MPPVAALFSFSSAKMGKPTPSTSQFCVHGNALFVTSTHVAFGVVPHACTATP